jgi:expansin (peptidoglycan-binding protein)
VSATGGQLPSGGASATGGIASTGGKSAATGGKSSSSTSSPSTGGTQSSGGSKATGGSNPGGANSGGANSGGATSTHATATGGSTAVGGTLSTGGTKAAGGTQATGGATSSTTIGPAHSGEITFYDDNGNGTCSFGVTGETDVAALAVGSWDNAAWCGACAEVSGSKGKLKVKVVNQCPSCGGAWDLDLNKSAFLKIEEEKVGRYVDTWNFVPCGITTPVKYRFKEGSSSGWTAVMVSDNNLPITKLEWSPNKNTWQTANREYYNYFVASSGFGIGPMYVRITAIDGQQLIDQLPSVQETLVVTGESNFN